MLQALRASAQLELPRPSVSDGPFLFEVPETDASESSPMALSTDRAPARPDVYEVAVSLTRPAMALQRAPALKRGDERNVVKTICIDLWLYMLGTFIGRESIPALRLTCRALNSVVTSTCWCWEFRLLPAGLMAPEEEAALVSRCRVRQWSTRIISEHLIGDGDDGIGGDMFLWQIGAVLQPYWQEEHAFGSPTQRPSAFPHNVCHQGCCHRLWARETREELTLMELEAESSDGIEFAEAVAKGIFFPQDASRTLTSLLVACLALCLIAGSVLQNHKDIPRELAYIPIWLVFGFFFPLMHVFYRHTTTETFVSAVVSTTGVFVSVLLQYFFRSSAPTISMMLCATPALLCVASLATYSLLLCYRWLNSKPKRALRVSILVVVTGAVPCLLLISVALFVAQGDGVLRTYGSSSSSKPRQHADYRAALVEPQAGGVPLLLISITLFVDLLHVFATLFSRDLVASAPIATISLLGYCLSCAGLGVLSLVLVLGVEVELLAGISFGILSAFLGSSFCNAVAPKIGNRHAYVLFAEGLTS